MSYNLNNINIIFNSAYPWFRKIKLYSSIFSVVFQLSQNHRTCCSSAMNAADNPPATGNVTNQARTILRKSFQSTPWRDLNHPTNTIDPTLQWVVEIGIPMLEARRTVKAEPTSIQKPLKIESFKLLTDSIYPKYCNTQHLTIPFPKNFNKSILLSLISPVNFDQTPQFLYYLFIFFFFFFKFSVLLPSHHCKDHVQPSTHS